jgi:diguanylate cyclase (GGDEF)-like protein
MEDVADALNRISIAVQFAVVLSISVYFVLLRQLVKLEDVRLWMWAWLANAAALTAVLIHAYAAMPASGHRLAIAVSLAGKAAFVVLMVAGARKHLEPGSSVRVPTAAGGALLVLAGLLIGLAVPQLWLARLGQGLLMGIVLAAGGAMVLRRATTTVTRVFGATLLAVAVLSLASAVLLAPALWGNRSGMAAFESFVFVLAWAELALGLGCIAAVATRREELLSYANRELLESQNRLSLLVDTDPLTNLSSRRSARRALDSVIETGGAVVFLDINHLDQINELCGRRAGDASLKHLAVLISKHYRPEDHVIRWGGDEFLVLAPGMTPTSAANRVAAIRKALRQPGDEFPPLSVAAGIAELHPGGDPASVIEEADRRMLADKRGS